MTFENINNKNISSFLRFLFDSFLSLVHRFSASRVELRALKNSRAKRRISGLANAILGIWFSLSTSISNSEKNKPSDVVIRLERDGPCPAGQWNERVKKVRGGRGVRSRNKRKKRKKKRSKMRQNYSAVWARGNTWPGTQPKRMQV